MNPDSPVPFQMSDDVRPGLFREFPGFQRDFSDWTPELYRIFEEYGRIVLILPTLVVVSTVATPQLGCQKPNDSDPSMIQRSWYMLVPGF